MSPLGCPLGCPGCRRPCHCWNPNPRCALPARKGRCGRGERKSWDSRERRRYPVPARCEWLARAARGEYSSSHLGESEVDGHLLMAMTFDATLKDMGRDSPQGFLAAFDRSPALPVRLLNVDLSTVTTAADLIVGLGHPVEEIVHLDFQSSAAAWKHLTC